MAVKKIGTAASKTKPDVITVKLPDPGIFAQWLQKRYVQLAYTFGDSEQAAAAAVSKPALVLGDAVGVPALPLDNPLSTASGAPKIPPGKNILPPGSQSPLPMHAPELLDTIEVPKSDYVIDVLIQVRKR